MSVTNEFDPTVIAPSAWQTAVWEIVGPANGAPLLGALPAPWQGVLDRLRQRYGPTAGAGLALRMGRAFARHALPPLVTETGLHDTDLRFLPWQRKMPEGLTLLSALTSQWFATEIAVQSTPQGVLWQAEQCPFGTGLCTPWIGFLQEALYWLSGGHWFAISSEADHACVFRVPWKPLY